MATSKSKSGSKSKPAKGKPAAKPAAKAAKAAKAAPAAKAAKAGPAAKAAKAGPAAKAAPAAKKSSTKPAAVATLTVAEIVASSEAIGFALTVRTPTGPMTYADDPDEIVVGPPTWFALTPIAPPTRPYLYLIQKEEASSQIVLISMVDGAGATRVPVGTGWQRAIVEGTLHLLASDHLLSRADIVALIGGHEPPPGSTKPPFS